MSIDQENTLPQEQTGYIEIPQEVSNIEITGGENSHISVYSSRDTVGKLGSDNIINTQPNSDNFCIELEDDKEPTFIEISLPEGDEFNLRINLPSGRVDVLNTTGNLEINTYQFEKIEITGHKGNIIITEEQNDQPGEVTLYKTKSDNITIQTQQSDIDLKNIKTKNLYLYTKNGNIEITGPVFTEKRDGNIKIHNDFGLTKLHNIQDFKVMDYKGHNIYPKKPRFRFRSKKSNIIYTGFENHLLVI